ncbi:hypothetical protein M0804_006976 [Polistes exclamans]|nr:hypothetical protein M0804_006976 [Polistes exclamans]
MKCDEKKRVMFSRRACSESGPHPGIPGPGPVGSGHLWSKRNQGRTSAPVVGDVKQSSIILKTRRSWPVAPTHCRRLLTIKCLVAVTEYKLEIRH